MQNTDTAPLPPAGGQPAPVPASARVDAAARRKARLLAGGGARLAAITGELPAPGPTPPEPAPAPASAAATAPVASEASTREDEAAAGQKQATLVGEAEQPSAARRAGGEAMLRNAGGQRVDKVLPAANTPWRNTLAQSIAATLRLTSWIRICLALGLAYIHALPYGAPSPLPPVLTDQLMAYTPPGSPLMAFVSLEMLVLLSAWVLVRQQGHALAAAGLLRAEEAPRGTGLLWTLAGAVPGLVARLADAGAALALWEQVFADGCVFLCATCLLIGTAEPSPAVASEHFGAAHA